MFRTLRLVCPGHSRHPDQGALQRCYIEMQRRTLARVPCLARQTPGEDSTALLCRDANDLAQINLQAPCGRTRRQSELELYNKCKGGLCHEKNAKRRNSVFIGILPIVLLRVDTLAWRRMSKNWVLTYSRGCAILIAGRFAREFGGNLPAEKSKEKAR